MTQHQTTSGRLVRAIRHLGSLAAGDATFATADDPVRAALAVAAAALGRSLAPVPAPRGEARAAARLQAFARDAGLLCREIHVDGDWRDAGEGPLIAFLGETPSVLLRRGARWRIVEPGEARSKVLDPRTAAGFGRSAWQIGPALPRRRLGPADVLLFGLHPLRGEVAGWVAASLTAGLLLALMPVATGFTVDTVVPDHEKLLMAEVAAGLATVIIANLMVRLASSLAEVRIRGRMSSLLRAAMIDRVVDAAAVRGTTSAPVLNVQVRAADQWVRGMVSLLAQAGSGLLAGAPSLLFLLWAAPAGAFAALAVAIVASLAVAAVVRLGAAALRRTVGSQISWMTVAYDSLAQIDTVRALGAERQLFQRFAEGFGQQQMRQLKAGRLAAVSAGIGAALEPAMLAAVIVATLVADKVMQSPRAIPALMAAAAVAACAGGLLKAFAMLPQLGMLRGLVEPMLAEIPPRHAGGGAPAPRLAGKIRLRGVSFRPEAGQPPTLDDATLDIEPGEHIGVIGPSGAGKTTLVDVMTGLRKPEAGLVAFDDIDIQKLDGASLRRQIGVVGQNAGLFAGSLRSNITLGDAHPDERIWRALRLAGIEEDVRRLPLGLSTIIGDGTPTLSGGQVQRLLVARAIVGDPPIVILDEATSALDPRAQAVVTAGLKQCRVTVISVAHRLETLLHCDRIYVMERGRIVEQGSPVELARASGPFSRLMAAETAA